MTLQTYLNLFGFYDLIDEINKLIKIIFTTYLTDFKTVQKCLNHCPKIGIDYLKYAFLLSFT